ncbi:MAG: hypothetical protein ACLT74_05485 [Christensenellales bacterium]
MAMLEINHLQKKFGTTEVLWTSACPSAKATSWRFWAEWVRQDDVAAP